MHVAVYANDYVTILLIDSSETVINPLVHTTDINDTSQVRQTVVTRFVVGSSVYCTF